MEIETEVMLSITTESIQQCRQDMCRRHRQQMSISNCINVSKLIHQT